MKIILFCGYRDWARTIFNELSDKTEYGLFMLWITPVQDLELIVKRTRPDAIFFVGWSKIVPNTIIDNYKCFCLHPSKLPEYRGGSPIQNQILDGVEHSAVTIFQMDRGIDTGPIVAQKGLVLCGNLSDIFQRIILVGTNMIESMIWHILQNRPITTTQQNEKLAFTRKRRTPAESEITQFELDTSTARYLYDKIRCLQDPYPNAFITCDDGKRLYITGAYIDD